MKLYKTLKGVFLQHDGSNYLLNEEWDVIINQNNLFDFLSLQLTNGRYSDGAEFSIAVENFLQAPIGRQEVWAAGVTYLRSRDARMDESKDSGGADFYSKVYSAERPELFFKALPQRV